MDPNAAPWRALETAGPGGQPAEPDPKATPSLPLAAIGALAAAAALAIVAFLLAFGSGEGELRLTGGEAVTLIPSEAPGSSAGTSRAELVVEVVGAVVRPGVYRLADGSRIGDLISQAGGYGPRVDTDRAARELNLAAQLNDGDQVRVPSRDDPAATPGQAGTGAGSGSSGTDSGGLIELNTATSSELESLPGIGPVTAGKIIAAREEQPFTTVDELRGRKLVGEKIFEGIRDLVTVR